MSSPDNFPTQKRRSLPTAADASFPIRISRGKKPHQIDILQTVGLGGVKQTIHISGENPDLPLLVFLHGGPGLPHMPFAHANAELTKWFLVVHWDQRGAGKSYSRFLRPQDMSIEQLVSDACELLVWLHAHFAPSALVLVGHSWGSALGALVAARSPHLISAFVGVGQVTNLRTAEEVRYKFCMEIARQQHDMPAIKVLRQLGAPPYANPQQSDVLEQLASRHVSKFYRPMAPRDFARLSRSSPIYSRIDLDKISLGRRFSEACLWDDIVSKIDLPRQVPRLDIPVLFLVGRHDVVVAHSLAKQYFDMLDAPQGKSFVTMHASGHWPHLEESELFRAILIGTIYRRTPAGIVNSSERSNRQAA